jgi:hypothetical protein
MSEPSQENRRSRRYGVTDVSGNLLYRFDIKVLDISLNGMQIESSKKLDIGRKYVIKVSHGNEALKLEGTVVWCVLKKSVTGEAGEFIPLYRAGIEFEGLFSDKASELVNFLRKSVVIKLEERLFGRFRFNLEDPVNLDCRYDFLVRDLSLAGMLIETEISPEINSVFDMELKVCEPGITVKGRVAYVKQGNDDEHKKSVHLGVEFLDMTDECRTLLEKFIKDELGR